MSSPVAGVFDRSERLLGAGNMRRLQAAHVAVCGLGGVGSFAAEAAARSAVGELTLIDYDAIEASNINRQLYALQSSIGCKKTELAAARIADIAPDSRLHCHDAYISADNCAELLEGADFIIDAIDHIPAKLALIRYAYERGIPFISAMGAARRLSPQLLRVADISQTQICPLARIMRRELKACGVTSGVRTVFSLEPPLAEARAALETACGAKQPLGSMIFVPAAMGMILAAEAVRHIIQSATKE
ncbi:MAG: tRNA threonylcarbamoyladenosine dehydratase [Bacillota bacterium]|nr:tRNA threonylcarbamoyladenosine dehydratase [Bacillota bacterium]